MAVVQTLEELIEYAIDPDNLSSNHERAMLVADQVNKEIGGPRTVIQLIMQKLHLRQEIITLQTLNVIECCVKNCGEKFHNEIGKYKFINELIKLLSPKYDAAITPQSIKDRVIELMYAWYCGLPKEKKIMEAYKMLKQQGIIKRDPVDAVDQNGDASRLPQNTVFEDKGNSQLLSALLASQDPEDLQSANKLIKSLVKQEEDRLDRVSKRIQDLETVNNNVRLLDEMLTNVTPQTLQADNEIMQDLYERCLKLRPELFRLASRSVEDKDDAMDEILSASDELTRVIDLYKEKVLHKKFDTNISKPFNISSTANEFSDFQDTSALLDLGFDGPTVSQSNQNGFSVSSSGNSLLDEQFKMLGLDTLTNTTISQPTIQSNSLQSATTPFNMQSTMSFSSTNAQQTFIPNTTMQPPLQLPPQPVFPSTSTGFTTANQGEIGSIRPEVGIVRPNMNSSNVSLTSPNIGAVSPNIGTVSPNVGKISPSTGAVQQNVNKNTGRPDVLNFNVFDQFKTEDFKKINVTKNEMSSNNLISTTTSIAGNKSDMTDGANQSAINYLIDVAESSNSPLTSSSQISQKPVDASIDSLLQLDTPPPISSTTTMNHTVQANTNLVSNTTKEEAHVQPVIKNEKTVKETEKSTTNTENYFVPLESLVPDVHEPIVVLDKDNIKSFLNIANDTRPGANKNVIVTILSTISTNRSPVTEFTIQVAVPKSMRVKLQPATSNMLAAFNPILPPASIAQIMLIANPAKEAIRLRFKISYTVNGVKHVENSSINQLPVN